MTTISQETPAPPAKFDSWAVVEVMGHTRVAGKVTEQSIAGVDMLRVDVPEVTTERSGYEWVEGYGQKYVRKQITMPAYTRYFGGISIFSITPCSEEIARKAAAERCSEPPVPLALPEKTLPAPKAEEELDPMSENPSETDGDGGDCVHCRSYPCVCNGQ